MNFRQFEYLLKKFTAGKASKEEEAYVLKWFEQIGMDIGADKKHVVQDDQRDARKQKAWNTLQQHIEKTNTPISTPSASGFRQAGRKLLFIKVAAAVLLVATLSIYLTNNFAVSEQHFARDRSLIHVLNTASVERIVELEDGSKVSLRPGSELKYPEHFTNIREVFLVGEAFFEISHDTAHPFLVHAKEVITKVLGTSFTIKAYADQQNVSVAVRTGRVVVSAPSKGFKILSAGEKQEVVLTPNQEVIVDSKTEQMAMQLVEKPQIVEVVPSLKMKYSNASVVEIFEKLEQAYGVPIKFDHQALASCTITTTFIDEDLYERVNMICYALGGEYRIENLEIQVLAKGCK